MVLILFSLCPVEWVMRRVSLRSSFACNCIGFCFSVLPVPPALERGAAYTRIHRPVPWLCPVILGLVWLCSPEPLCGVKSSPTWTSFSGSSAYFPHWALPAWPAGEAVKYQSEVGETFSHHQLHKGNQEQYRWSHLSSVRLHLHLRIALWSHPCLDVETEA